MKNKTRSDVMNFIIDSIGVDGGFYMDFVKERDEASLYYGSPEKDIESMNCLMREMMEENPEEVLESYHLTKGKILSISMKDLKDHDLIENNQIKYPLIMRELGIVSNLV